MATKKQTVTPETGEVSTVADDTKKRPAPKKTTKRAASKPAQENEPDRPEEQNADFSKDEAKLAVEPSEYGIGEEMRVEEAPEAGDREESDIPEAAQDSEPDRPEEQSVDFSEDEVMLAVESPEYDLGEETMDEEISEVGDLKESKISEAVNELATKTKQELLAYLESIIEEGPIQNIRRNVEAVKIAFYKRYNAEVDQLSRAFTEAGNEPETFVPPLDEAEQKLKELFAKYRKKRDEYLSTLERRKEDSLAIKQHIIEELKELVNSNETLNHTFNTFRDLQQKWRETGPVPIAYVKDVWETYNHHVENFYNYIKINKELRDLDLKRNYEAKTKLCEEAEALFLDSSVINAFNKLQKLHEQWRETGPVVPEHKEAVWERFKAASSRINKQHQEHFDRLKAEQQRNYELKRELCKKVEDLCEGIYTQRKDWAKASEELVEIQKVWKRIGFAPKKENTKIYERFRATCDRFFELKRNYYLGAKSEMEHKLQQKIDICALAESLQESEDWNKTTDEFIALQKRWKEIGPVARRHSDAVWKRFRTACDRFFERKGLHFSEWEAEHDVNLASKRALLEEMEAYSVKEAEFDAIKEFQRRWNEIGHVPFKHKEAFNKKFRALVDTMFASLKGNDRDRSLDRFKTKISTMKSSGGNKLRSERERLYSKVKLLESDIATLENNIGFFSKSRNAEAMIAEVKPKIEKSKEEMNRIIEKVKLIDRENGE